MSTAQGHMNDKLRNHGLPVPKEADTAEPMSAEERAQHLFFGTTYPDRIVQKVAEQIRQAEQAARSKEFMRGFEAGQAAARRARNTSGCCCQIGDDGETILSTCEAHSAWRAHERRKALEEAAQLAETFFDWCKPIGEHRNMAMAQEFGEECAERIRANSSEPGENA